MLGRKDRILTSSSTDVQRQFQLCTVRSLFNLGDKQSLTDALELLNKVCTVCNS